MIKPRWDSFDVILNKKHIDTVQFLRGTMTAEEVRQSLINHDGYNPSIQVRKVQS